MARAKKVEFYQAKESFVTHMGDEQVSVTAGERVRAGHPLLKGRESLFIPAVPGRFEAEQDEDEAEEKPVVEAATSAPGEKRGA
jgi:hypothetical protein